MLLATDVDRLFNIEVPDIDISKNPIMIRIKHFIVKVPNISPELQLWASDISNVVINPQSSSSVSSSSTSSDFKDFKVSALMGQKTVFSSISSNTSYDISSEHLLTYTELRAISINIAKNMLNVTVKDETITILEQEKRRSLITEIQEYKRIKEFNFLEDDLQKMSLEQLESYKEMCEKTLNKFKVNDVLSSSFSLCAIGYNTIFPEGIPVGSSKIEFGDIGKEIRSHFLDNRSPTGFSFARILSKYDLSISDELMLLIAAGEIALKNVKFKKRSEIKKNTEKPPKKINRELNKELDIEDELSDLD
jgi:hypothetical protein